MERKYNYFYRIDNKINGNFYYGVHKTNNLDDGYMGSGVRLTYAKKKYGIENFEKHILEFFDTYKEALEFESEIVNEKLLLDASCYNLALGGQSDTGLLRQGPSLVNKISGELINPKDIEEYKLLWNTGEYNGFSKNKGIYKFPDGTNKMLNTNDPLIKELNLKGSTYNKITCKDSSGNFISVYVTDERYLNKELIPIWKNKKHSEKSKNKIKKTMSRIKHQQGKSNSQYGTIFIHNIDLKKNKRIKKEEINDWINLGWIKGAKFKW